MNPSYFDVNYRVQGFDTLPYQLDNVQLNVQWLLFPIISEYYNIIEELYQELSRLL